MNRRRFLLIAAAMTVQNAARAEVTSWQAEMLGGLVRVDLRGPRGLSRYVAESIGTTIAEIEATASLFKPTSAISHLNTLGHLDNPPAALLELLHLAAYVHEATGGRFDPTVQPLWRALAEGRDTTQARAAIGWKQVRVGPSVRLGERQAVTFNGIAQGYAADRVRSLLRDAGYAQALVEMGEFAALGGPFNVSVEDPTWGRVAIRRLGGTAIATSSPSAMTLGNDFHILGPHGERPCWSTISVEAESAAIADGLSTAFCLMSADEIRATRDRIREVTRVTAVDATGDVSTF
ncbi:FAD:protein FMN transferase [Ciceribacter thiooxidans]|uniref:FAD:protein FMN transferase n=1 Tax=Ciceribacter thiooxidans TaxID=1969821 RepID=A0ABV7I6P8_9HYPH|nr:FAD:protein FMN transferase [Ciceribacter thiooxidans]